MSPNCHPKMRMEALKELMVLMNERAFLYFAPVQSSIHHYVVPVESPHCGTDMHQPKCSLG